MLEIGSLVGGRYRILNEVCRGGSGVVCTASDETSGMLLTVIEVRREDIPDFEALRGGLAAGTYMLKKPCHPNIPNVTDIIDAGSALLIITDYFEGQPLSDILNEYGAQPQEKVVEWAKQLCGLLDYLHSQVPAIFLGEMGPEKIVITPDGSPMFIGFGKARKFDQNNSADAACTVIDGYDAPEQLDGGRIDERTDIYRLGAVIYHLLTGQAPSGAQYGIGPIRETDPTLSVGLEKIILKCTERRPKDRYKSAAELMYALERYDEDEDGELRKNQKYNLSSFITAAAAALIFACIGFLLSVLAAQKATDMYRSLLDEAERSASYGTKINLYKDCIALPDKAGKKEAYFGLIQTYKENDAVFSVDEAQQLEDLIKNNLGELRGDPENYTEICFETGKLFWYYYDDGGDGGVNRIARADKAAEWFRNVLSDAPDDYGNIGIASVYADICTFYKDTAADITGADDKGKYAPLLEDLNVLLDSVASNRDESEIVRLEVLELARSAVQQYAAKFKTDGISRSELEALLSKLTPILGEIGGEWEKDPSDVRTVKKQHIESLTESTEQAVRSAYGTGGGTRPI